MDREVSRGGASASSKADQLSRPIASLYLATVLLHAIDSLGEGQPGLSTTSYDPVFDETPRAILELGSGTGFLSIFIAQWMAQLQRSRSRPHSPGGSAIEIWSSDLADDGDGDDDDEGDASLARDEAKSARRTPFATLRDNLAISECSPPLGPPPNREDKILSRHAHVNGRSDATPPFARCTSVGP